MDLEIKRWLKQVFVGVSLDVDLHQAVWHAQGAQERTMSEFET